MRADLATLAAMDAQTRNEQLGNALYAQVFALVDDDFVAAQVVGMLLELSDEQV